MPTEDEPSAFGLHARQTRRAARGVLVLSRPSEAIAMGLLLLACSACGETSTFNATPPPPSPPPLTAADAVISVDPSVVHQTIVGWEATAQAGQDESTFPLFKDELFDRAVNELGLNRLRLQVRSGLENGTDWKEAFRSGQIDKSTWRCVRYATENDNNDPFDIEWTGFQFSGLDARIEAVVLPLMQRLEGNGESLFINVTYVAFTDQICEGGEYHHDDSPEEYAEFVVAVHLHLREKYGLVPDSWEVILEPDNTDFWRGRQIGESIVAAAARLEELGFDTPFVAPSSAHMGRSVSYFDDLTDVDGALQLLSELSYHRYGGVSDTNLRSIAERRKRFGIQAAMLEHIGSGYEDLHKDLKIANASAWQQFTLAFPTSDNGAQYYVIDNVESSAANVRIGNRTRFLRQYFRYIRRGARRIEATTRNTDFDPVAFINADGSYVVAIKADSGGEITIAGLPAGSYGVNYATLDDYNVDGPVENISDGEVLLTGIPDRGVLTVYQR